MQHATRAFICLDVRISSPQHYILSSSYPPTLQPNCKGGHFVSNKCGSLRTSNLHTSHTIHYTCRNTCSRLNVPPTNHLMCPIIYIYVLHLICALTYVYIHICVYIYICMFWGVDCNQMPLQTRRQHKAIRS